MNNTATTPLARLSRVPRPNMPLATRMAPLTRGLVVQIALATMLYLGYACYQTWPLVTDLAHNLYGAAGDPYGSLAFFRELVAHHKNPFLPGTITQFAAPEGQTIPWLRDLASAPEILSLYLLTALFGPLQAFGLNTLAGYTLTGTATFLLARRLTGNTWASLIAGWAYAFYPFAALNGQVHPDGISGWVLIIAVWRMIELLWYPTRRNGLLAGLAVIFCMWWSPYFILFIGVTYFVMTLAASAIAIHARSLRTILAPQLIAATLIVIFLGLLVVLSTASSAESPGLRTHTTAEVAGYGAKPLQYLLPDDHSLLFGRYTRPTLARLRRHGTGYEDTLYPGGTVFLLAVVALIVAIRRRLTPRLRHAVLVLWLVAIAAFVTSFPPEPSVLGIHIPFPAHFITQVTSTWRVYSRFVMVVMLALSLLAAVGLDALTQGRRSSRRTIAMLCATLLVPLDLADPQPGHVEKIVTPSIYRVLAREPAGLVAEYPLTPHDATYRDVFFQNAYEKPLINGFVEGSLQEKRAYSLYNLANPTTASRLADLGVKYVLLDTLPDGLGWPSAGKPRTGFRRVARERYAALYVVTARARSPALATVGSGFAESALRNGKPADLLVQPSGVIALAGSCASCSGILSLTITPNTQPRHVTLSDERGHIYADGVVSRPTQIEIPLRFAGHIRLIVTATPSPTPPPATTGLVQPSIIVLNLAFSNEQSHHEQR